MEPNIQLAVVLGLIRNSGGKILLQKRIDTVIPDAHEKWELPGGKIDFGETPEHAVRRECKEEVGCDVRVIRLLPLAGSNMWQRTDGRKQQAVYICYEVEWVSGDPKPLDKKVSEVMWCSKGEILAMDTLLPGVRELVSLIGD
ncbi:MAG: NUDIX domain-containing protein [bacterium]|nr:NUDIX domain-containing protein [bacterium]